MAGATAWVQISAGRCVDTNGTPWLQKNPQQDVTQELNPMSWLQRCLFSSALFRRGRLFLYFQTPGRYSLHCLVSGAFIFTFSMFWQTEECGGSGPSKQVFQHFFCHAFSFTVNKRCGYEFNEHKSHKSYNFTANR